MLTIDEVIFLEKERDIKGRASRAIHNPSYRHYYRLSNGVQIQLPVSTPSVFNTALKKNEVFEAQLLSECCTRELWLLDRITMGCGKCNFMEYATTSKHREHLDRLSPQDLADIAHLIFKLDPLRSALAMDELVAVMLENFSNFDVTNLKDEQKLIGAGQILLFD